MSAFSGADLGFLVRGHAIIRNSSGRVARELQKVMARKFSTFYVKYLLLQAFADACSRKQY